MSKSKIAGFTAGQQPNVNGQWDVAEKDDKKTNVNKSCKRQKLLKRHDWPHLEGTEHIEEGLETAIKTFDIF